MIIVISMFIHTVIYIYIYIFIYLFIYFYIYIYIYIYTYGAFRGVGGYCRLRYCRLESLERELLVCFRWEDKLEKLELTNLSSMRVSNRIIPPFRSSDFTIRGACASGRCWEGGCGKLSRPADLEPKTAVSVEWKVPGVLGGNEVPNWKDNSGSAGAQGSSGLNCCYDH